MSDLHGSTRELRQKLYRLEVLLDIEKGRRGSAPRKGSAEEVERTAALARLSSAGLIESTTGKTRLTSEGREFLKDVRGKVSSNGMLDWTRVDEIDFSRL